MLILIDDADVQAIADVLTYLPVDGVTTNPTILSSTGRNPVTVLREIREMLPARAQLHVQLVSTTTDGMVNEAKALTTELGNDLYVKIPVTRAGYSAIPQVCALGFNVTATGIHSAMQGFMAAKAGAKYIAPYVNRMDNYGIDGVRVAQDMHKMLRAHDMDADVLAASFKNSEQVLELVRAGIGAITAAPDVLAHLVGNPATDWAIADQNNDFADLVGGSQSWVDLLHEA